MSLSEWTLIAAWDDTESTIEDLWDFEYLESQKSGTGGTSLGASNAQRIFYVRWDRLPAFLDDCLGWSKYNVSFDGINRVLPDEHPAYKNFWATDASWEGLGVGIQGTDSDIKDLTQFIQFPLAKVTVNYKPVDYPIEEDDFIESELDRYVTKKPTFGMEFMKVDTGGATFRWVTRSGHDLVNNPPALPVATMNLEYTWHEVPAEPDNPFVVPQLVQIQECYCHVNSIDFDGYKEGTVLFLGCEAKLEPPRLSVSGSYFWELTFKFAVRDNGPWVGNSSDRSGWNYLWDGQYNRWDQVTSGPNAGKPYQGGLGFPIIGEKDLNLLFTIS